MGSLAPAEKAPAGKPLKVGSGPDVAQRKPDRSADAISASDQQATPPCAACAAGEAPCPACGGKGGAGMLQRKLLGSQNGGAFIQAKLTVSQPGDAQELEAERVADTVMRMSDSDGQLPEQLPKTIKTSNPSVQRLSADCDEELSTRAHGANSTMTSGIGELHRQESSEAASQVPPSVVANIDAMQGGGSPLPLATRAFFEPRFGADFSHVRVHTGSRAEETSKAISAKAFTVGTDIVFAEGEYAPESRQGQQLLAHELTHVVQQNPGELSRDFQYPVVYRTPQATSLTKQVNLQSSGKIVQRGLLDDIGDAISDRAKSAFSVVTDLASDAVDSATSAIDSIKNHLEQALDAGLGQIIDLWALVRSGATTAVDGAIEQASGSMSGIGELFGAVGKALNSLDVDSLQAAWGVITGMADAALAGGRGLVAQATATMDGLWSGLKGLANRVIGGLQATASRSIGHLPGAVQGLARSLWNKIEARLTNTWRAIESEWLLVRETAVKRVNQLVATIAAVVASLKNSVISVIIDTLDQARDLFTFLKEVMANPDILIDPMVEDITERLQELPENSRAYVQTKVRENAAGGPGTAAAAPAGSKVGPVIGPTSAPAATSINRFIQRSAAPAGEPRSTLSVGDVISGCWDLITDKLKALWASLGTTVKDMVLSLVWPPDTLKALEKDWTQMKGELSMRVSRFESVRTDTWDGFSEDISRYLSNLADFPLIVWRAANAMLGHLSVYIGLALVLGGAVAGAIAVGTGGAVFGSVVPAAGTAAGAGLGIGSGFLAGAAAGYAVAETVGAILLASFVIAEELSIEKSLADLLGVPQSEAEQKEDFSQVADSSIAIVTAVLLMLIAFFGVALAKRVWAFVKSIPGLLRPKPQVVEPKPVEGKGKAPGEGKGKAGDADLGFENGKRVVAEEATADGKHKIKVTEDGVCLRCTDCGTLIKEYAIELNELKHAAILAELEAAEATVNLKLKARKMVAIEEKLAEIRKNNPHPNDPKLARQARIEILARDPAQGGKATPKTVREAEVAVAMEDGGRLQGPIRRDSTGGADFIAGDGKPWDVKRLESGRPAAQGGFDLVTDCGKIEASLSLGENVILDTGNMSASDIASLKAEGVKRGWGDRVLFFP